MNTTILLIDDDQSVRESLAKLLTNEGYEVCAACDGAEAMDWFNSTPVGLAVLDINLGTESGWTLLEAMTAGNARVPVIVITGEWGQRERAEASRVAGLIEKPIDVPVLLDMIRDLLVKGVRQRRGRLLPRANRCRYVSRHYEPHLRSLQERYSTPFHIAGPGVCSAAGSPAVSAAPSAPIPACPNVDGWSVKPEPAAGQASVPRPVQ